MANEIRNNMKTAEGAELKDDLSNYDHSKYRKPSVTVDIIIFSVFHGALRVLLIKRKHPPFRDYWAIPGGFVNIESAETLEEAARRELHEETNLRGIFIEQLKTYGDPKRDPRMRVITVAYYALVPYDKAKDMVRAGDDAAEAEWHAMDKLPRLAFDHAKILNDAKERIRSKASYSSIVFNIMPKKFTWTELQSVYEIVLGRPFLAPNFRRKIKARYFIRESDTLDQNQDIGRPGRIITYGGEKDQL